MITPELIFLHSMYNISKVAGNESRAEYWKSQIELLVKKGIVK